MTRAEAQALVATLAAAWPRQAIEQSTLDIYAHDLADLDLAVAAEAVEEARRTLTFFPTIAEIRSSADKIRLGAPSLSLAWEQAVTRGRARHHLVQRAREIVGDDWTWRTEPAGSLRRSFAAAYREICEDALYEIRHPGIAAAAAELRA